MYGFTNKTLPSYTVAADILNKFGDFFLSGLSVYNFNVY